MKKLTIKNVALAMALAGYAASSAFALDATTNQTIVGNAPILKGSAGTDHTVNIALTRSGAAVTDQVKVGDVITVSYTVADADGDTESTAGESGKTLVMYYKLASAPTVWVAAPTTTTVSASGKADFTIPAAMIGATDIGFKIQENTQYGAPATGLWIYVADIWSNNGPGTNVTDPGDPGDGGNGTGTEGGGGDKPGGTGPVTGDSVVVGIFKVNAGTIDKTVNYAAAGAPAPKYGDVFEAIVWNDENTDNQITAGEAELTASYTTFAWSLSGNNTAANGATTLATPVAITGATAVQYTISTVNSAYSSSYEAGAQGFNLRVEASL
ncbi:hypothetical protein [Zophobihabitans entericus]|uniref:Ornithine carbamoyltransferase n=1 Tax=Zophobihabitans entericus TaxID=1635327 RepID=A0A6G9I9Y7_9GAMM|nr:hypothetical protein [Zophobihabitans entericus]QIQ20642.1 hypothetical protein IPMB12_02440 [Zophobihabitans entericus]